MEVTIGMMAYGRKVFQNPTNHRMEVTIGMMASGRKVVQNPTNNRMEATIGMMASGNKNFPVLFGETKTSLIMEFVGDPHTLHPADNSTGRTLPGK